jgi:hypothetical protein
MAQAADVEEEAVDDVLEAGLASVLAGVESLLAGADVAADELDDRLSVR